MRRVAVCLVCVMVLLAGCAVKRPPTEPVSEGFTCTVQATYRDIPIQATLTRETAGALTLEFHEPSTLNGLTARWNGEEVTLSMYGLSFSVDPATVPESALGEELLAVFDTVRRGEGERNAENGTLTVNGNGENGEYTVVFDEKTGYPLSLSVPSLPLVAEFSNVQ